MAYHGFKPAEQAIQIGADEILSSHISDGVIVNADINSSAAIATSKVSGALTAVGSHGLATSATTDTTSASNISSGTLAAARVATLNQNTTGTAATVTTAAQTSITSVGTLTGLTVNSAITLGVSGSTNGKISAPEALYFNIDSDGTQTDTEFVWGTNRTGDSGGTELMRLTESGRVGIGTDAPADDGLSIAYPGSAPQLQLKMASSGHVHITNNTSAKDMNFATTGTGNMYFALGGANRVVFTDTGEVGIGTLSPSASDWGSANPVLAIHGTQPVISIKDTNDDKEFVVGNNAGEFVIWNSDTNVYSLKIDQSANTTFAGKITVSGASTNTFTGSIQCNDNIMVTSGKGVYFDSGSNTYIKENSGDTMGFWTGGNNVFTLTDHGVFTGNVTVAGKSALGGTFVDYPVNMYGSNEVLAIRSSHQYNGALSLRVNATASTGGTNVLYIATKASMAGSGTDDHPQILAQGSRSLGLGFNTTEVLTLDSSSNATFSGDVTHNGWVYPNKGIRRGIYTSWISDNNVNSYSLQTYAKASHFFGMIMVHSYPDANGAIMAVNNHSTANNSSIVSQSPSNVFEVGMAGTSTKSGTDATDGKIKIWLQQNGTNSNDPNIYIVNRAGGSRVVQLTFINFNN